MRGLPFSCFKTNMSEELLGTLDLKYFLSINAWWVQVWSAIVGYNQTIMTMKAYAAPADLLKFQIGSHHKKMRLGCTIELFRGGVGSLSYKDASHPHPTFQKDPKHCIVWMAIPTPKWSKTNKQTKKKLRK